MLVSSFNLSQSFNYAPYLFCEKRFKSEINCFCIRADPDGRVIDFQCVTTGRGGGHYYYYYYQSTILRFLRGVFLKNMFPLCYCFLEFRNFKVFHTEKKYL
jgi:hypothetical protein